MRFLVSSLIAFLTAAPAAAGWLNGYVDSDDGKLGLLAGVDIARGPEEWAFYIQVGQPGDTDPPCPPPATRDRLS